jgi:hypothetical protein
MVMVVTVVVKRSSPVGERLGKGEEEGEKEDV